MIKFLQDCRHVGWLFKQMIVLGIKGDWEGSIEAWTWIKLHWNYESKKLK